MSRPLRIEYPGAFYHIISRGNEKGDIFKKDGDYRKFLEKLSENVIRYQLKVHAYCLMRNHYHLIMETLKGNLTKAMHWLNSAYASYFNTKYERAGHLLQGRYKSILVQADEYLNHLSRYIHLNPVRAQVTEYPGEYKWSSYKYFISEENRNDLLEREFTLKMFSEDMSKARRLYREFVEADMAEEKVIIKDNIIKGFVLGKEKFVEWINDKFLTDIKEKEIPQKRQITTSVSVEKIHNRVSERIRNEKAAKKIMVYLIRKYTEEKLDEISNRYGKLSSGRISQLYHEIEEDRKKNRKLDELLSSIEDSLKT